MPTSSGNQSLVLLGTIVGMVALGFFLSFSTASAQTIGDLEVEAEGMTAIATFIRPTPCTPYTIDWSDGATDAYEAAGDLCAQVIEETTVRHDYWDTGRYTVTLSMNGETESERVRVPDGELTFDIDDIESVTTQWIDPGEELLEKEGFVHTITLKNGTQVLVETRDLSLEEEEGVERFRDAGFSGDIADLVDAFDSGVNTEPAVPEPKNARIALYQQLTAVLTALIDRLEMLVELRSQQTS